MTTFSSRAARVRHLFDQAVDLDRSARAAFLEVAEPDEDVRREVRALLEADASPRAILRATPKDLVAAVEPGEAVLSAHLVGRHIGPYEVVSVLGEGGMGTVCLAVREGIEMTVAIKLVRGALGDPGRIARFEREKRVLARLSHPHIAKLMDVGVADDRTPYLVMEYVDGAPITQWCREHHLGVRERLRLFIHLCDAVSFAHSHLVVHRDLKPSNVFVTKDGVVKLLDFGVAKLLSADNSDAGLTNTGVRVLSPSYASPEQVSGDAISTATDVHGLGLLLFELLTGQRPYGTSTSKVEELAAAVLSAEPRRPSTLMDESHSAVGDLDAICLKALAKKPAHRYASVAVLLDDVERHLAGQPVLARLPTLPYRAGKFVRRNRVGVAVGGLVLSMILAGVGVAAWQAAQARAALSDAQELSAFLITVFRSNDPTETRDTDIPMRGFIDLAMAHIDKFDGRPQIQARMVAALSEAYIGLGDYKRAEELASRSLDLRRSLGSGHDVEVASSLVALGSARFERGDAPEAARLIRSALDVQRRALGDRDRETTSTMLKLARVLRTMGEYDGAERLAKEAVSLRRAVTGRYNDDVVEAIIVLGETYWFAGRLEGPTEQFFRSAVEILEQLHGPDDYRVDPALTSLAAYLAGNTRHAEAEHTYQRSLGLRRRMYGESHPRVLAQTNNLASVILAQGRVAEARALYLHVVQRYERFFEGDHLMLALALREVSRTHLGENRLDSAEFWLTRALRMRVRLEGADAPPVADLYRDLGSLQMLRGSNAAAVASLRTAHAAEAKQFGERHPRTLRTASLLGSALDAARSRAEAEALLRAVVTTQRETLREPHPDLALSIARLGTVLLHQGRTAEATQELDRALYLVRAALSADQEIRREVVAMVMSAHRAIGRSDLAERLRREEQGVARTVTAPRVR